MNRTDDVVPEIGQGSKVPDEVLGDVRVETRGGLVEKQQTSLPE